MFYRFLKDLYETLLSNSYSSYKDVWDEWKNGDELAKSMSLSLKELINKAITDANALIEHLQKRKKTIVPGNQEFVEIDKQISEINLQLSNLCEAKARVTEYISLRQRMAQTN